MSVSSLIADLSRQDVQLWMQDDQLHFDGPDEALTDDALEKLRRNKAGILKYLAEAARERRYRELMQVMAEDDQHKKHYWLTDTESDPDYVILAVGIRDVATCELKIPREKYDPFLLMETLESDTANSGVPSPHGSLGAETVKESF